MQSSTKFGDQDGRKNGIVQTKQLPEGHTYRIDQMTAPKGCRIFTKDKRVVTVAGKNATATFANRAAR